MNTNIKSSDRGSSSRDFNNVGFSVAKLRNDGSESSDGTDMWMGSNNDQLS
jgi:hypothetical protein